MALNLANDSVWINKKQFDAAETQYYESLTKELMKIKKGQINCNGNANAHELTQHSNSNDEKPKKSTKNKNKGNSNTATHAHINGIEEPTSTTSNKPNAKKNKKKNKSQSNKEDVETTSTHQNNNSTKKQPNTFPNDSKRGTSSNNHCTLVSEIAKAREHIKNSLEKMDGMANIGGQSELVDRLIAVEKENAALKGLVENLKNLVLDSQKRIAALEGQSGSGKQQNAKITEAKKSETADDDDGVDLFASDSDDESAEAARVREERLAAYAAKKSKKPALIAKSSLILDVKPWDDETDLKAMEAQIRTITADGLLWGASKFVPVAFGIQKLSISCVVEDDKVSIDWLTEEIEKFEDFVQSVDVAAFNKI